MRRNSPIIRGNICVALLGLGTAGRAAAVGEAVDGFPNWQERVLHQWTNRARVDPQLEMNACGANCVEGACYGIRPPLAWSEALNRAARFHSDAMARQGFFSHTSACTLVSNIDSLYPGSCDGSASCACVGGTRTCSPTCTDFAARVRLFGAQPSGEIIASPIDPNSAFYLWLYEPGDTTQCQFTSRNGHRWLLLSATGAVGMGVASPSGPSTGDFGSGSAPAKIPSGSHYPRQAASVEAWTNWYDTAGPSSASINVDGVCTPMTLRRGSATNGAWSATLSGVGSGCRRYYFSFRDAGGATVTYPTSGSLAIGSGTGCPDWDSSRPAECAAGPTSPSPTPSATATATASATRTGTRTGTATASATPTTTGTSTRTGTATTTPTPTPSATPTATLLLSGEDIGGTVRYHGSALAVPDVTLRAGPLASAATDAAGAYLLGNVPALDVVVSAERVGGTGGAISPLDASWALQAVANLRTFSAEQLLACDVTGNGTVSSLDASLILQRTVGLIDRLPVAEVCGSDWAFIPDPAAVPGQTLIDPQPGIASCTPGGIAYASIDATLAEQDFAALVFGDCTGNWRPPSAAGALRAESIRARGTLRAMPGQRLALAIAIEHRQALPALELRVRYDGAALRVERVRLANAAAGAMLASHAEPSGTLRVAVASATPFVAGRRPIAIVVFAVAPGAVVEPPAVTARAQE